MLKPKAPSTRPPANLKDALSEARAITGAGVQRQPSTAPTSFAPPGRKTIIIADDDAAHRARLRAGIEVYYDVLEAKDGMEAVELAAKSAPAMIICDVVMPKVDGFTLAKIMKCNPNTKRIPIMFISARSGPQEVTQALVLGACHYFPKTASVAEVIAKVRKIIP